ncbi:hypothetical protein E4P24_16255 [Haloferax sp. AS1]|uniref:hypothetical protein n=1 Tax=Haloferax TaxID=2251 RepID=UPI00165F1945|nr:hypothetical protein [Haloferax sp. AS1]MBC9987906.1 hypothetical protein [Haloferax sp. AS1]
MNKKQAFDRFTTFETANSAFSKSYNGVYYWDRIRCQVFSEVLEKTGIWSTNRYDFDPQRKNLDIIADRVTQGVNSLRSLIDSPLFTGDRDILFAAATTSRREFINGSYWDVLVDPLADDMEYSYTSLENKSGIRNECDDNIWTQDTTATDQIQFISDISQIIGPNITFQDDGENDIVLLEDKIEEIFNIDINLVGRVANELTQRKYTKPLYELLLERIDPEIVFIRYNPSKSTLIEVSQEVGIPVVELQHGVDFNHSHSISYDTPIEGEVCFPDVYLSWGEYWCDKPDFPIDDIRVVGWPFLEFVSKDFSSQEAGNGILFISQPDCGEELSKIAVEVAKTTDWEIIYRLHPKERTDWKSFYPWLESQSIHIDSGERALYDVMSDCWAQVGTESTALYEGLKFNLNTFIYEDFDAETHPWYEVEGIEVFANSDGLNEYLRQRVSTDVEADWFFKSNSIENIQREIAEII